MLTYESYCADMKKFGQEPMSEALFNEMQGISDIAEPLMIQPKKDYRKAAASLESFIKVAESSKRRRSKPISEVLPKKPKAQLAPLEPQKHKEKSQHVAQKPKKNRSDVMRKIRARWKEQGLTSKGKPYKEKGEKPEPTTEQTRAKRCEYARKYREKNREKHLAYRREYRKKQNEAKNNTCTFQKAS